jgi:hypothetical protein
MAGRAQQVGRLPIIGVLGVGTPSGWVLFTGASILSKYHPAGVQRVRRSCYCPNGFGDW